MILQILEIDPYQFLFQIRSLFIGNLLSLQNLLIFSFFEKSRNGEHGEMVCLIFSLHCWNKSTKNTVCNLFLKWTLWKTSAFISSICFAFQKEFGRSFATNHTSKKWKGNLVQLMRRVMECQRICSSKQEISSKSLGKIWFEHMLIWFRQSKMRRWHTKRKIRGTSIMNEWCWKNENRNWRFF